MKVRPETPSDHTAVRELITAAFKQPDDCRFVAVLGHSSYYPRFGFVAASQYAISSVYEVPDEVFMALELAPGALADRAGKLFYHKAFDGM